MIENTEEDNSEDMSFNFAKSSKANKEYLISDEAIADAQEEVDNNKLAPIAAKETAKYANDDDTGVFSSVKNFGKHVGIGAAKGVEEVGQTVGLLEDDEWKLQSPKTTAESLAQGFGQFLPLFIPSNMVLGAGLRAASIFTKSKRLTKAGELLSATAAGAITDFAAFDPKDPNAANFLLVTGAISEDSMAGAALKTYLAQDDSDSELKARMKSATSGVLAGVVVDQLIRGVGGLYRTVKGGKPNSVDGVPLNEIKSEVKEKVDEFLDGADQAKEQMPPEDFAKMQKGLSGNKAAIKAKVKAEKEDYVRPFERLSPEKQDEVLDVVTRWGRGEKAKKQDLSIIETINFSKVKDKDVGQLLQYLSVRVDSKELVKGKSIATEDFDTLSGASKFSGIPEEQLSRVIEEQGVKIREAIPFVGVSRAMSTGQEALSLEASKKYAATGLEVHEKAMHKHQKLAWDFAAAGGDLGKASSDLLRSFSKAVNDDENQQAISFMLMDSVIKQPPEVSIKQAGWSVVKKSIDDQVLVVQHFGGAARKFTKKSTTELIEEKVKNLEGRLASEKSPSRGKKGHTLTSPKIRELEERIKQVKYERATLREKVTPTKEQLTIRKEFERLSKQILDVENGVVKAKKLKPVELTELKAHLKKVTKAYKDNLPEEAKLALRMQKLNNEYSKVLLTKKKDIKTKDAIEETPDELEIKAAIKKHKERLGIIGKKELTHEELLEMVMDLATQGELEAIGKSSLAQLKARLKAMNKGKIARTKDALLEVYVNGLLSSPKTFIINLVGNSIAIGTSVMERSYAGFIKKGGDVSAQEAKELVTGYFKYLGSMPDLFKLTKQAWDLEPTVNIKQDLIRPHERNISADAWRVSGLLGQTINVLGSVVNFPGKLVLSADEVFKAINYSAERRALAYRKAYTELGTEGGTVEEKAAITKRFAEIMQDIGEHADIEEQAVGFAAKNTYTNTLASHPVKDSMGKVKEVPGLALRVKGILDADPSGIARVFVPFFQTPANLLAFAWERTPLIRKFNKTLQRELHIDAPAAVRELAEAKIATSRMMWGGMMLYAWNGNVTGAPPADPVLRKSLERAMGGPNWYSKNLGDGWKRYDRFDPLGVMMGAAANFAIIGKASINLNGYNKEEDLSGEIHDKYIESLSAGTIGLVKLIGQRHYLKGFAELMGVLTGEGNLGYKGKELGKKMITAIDPRASFYSSFRRNLTTGFSPEKAEDLQGSDGETIYDFAKEILNMSEEALRAVTPGYGTRVAVKDLVGNPVLFPGTNAEVDTQPFQVITNMANNLFNPNPALVPSKSPLINKIADLEIKIEQPSSINKLNGVMLEDDEKAFFITEWTSLNKGLDYFVGGKAFNSMPEGSQRLLIENKIKDFKKKAKEATLAKYRRLMVGSATNIIQGKQSEVLKEVPKGNLSQRLPQLFNLGQG